MARHQIKIPKGNAVIGFPTSNAKKYAPTTKITPTYYKTSLLNGLLTSSVVELINPQYRKYLVISLSTSIEPNCHAGKAGESARGTLNNLFWKKLSLSGTNAYRTLAFLFLASLYVSPPLSYGNGYLHWLRQQSQSGLLAGWKASNLATIFARESSTVRLP